MIEAFPKDPEQWIYNKAAELAKMSTDARVNTRSRFMTPEDLAIEQLEIEVSSLRLAIKHFNNLYKKFLENQYGSKSI